MVSTMKLIKIISKNSLTTGNNVVKIFLAVYLQGCPSWPKEHDWKSCKPSKRFRGFKSLALRQKEPNKVCWVLLINAPVVKLADTLDSDSSRVFSVQVQVLSGAPKKRSTKCASLLTFINYLCTRPEPSPPANFSTSETETLL